MASTFQTVKEPMHSSRESMGFRCRLEKYRENEGETRVIPTPDCQLFEVHGSKFKPDPSCDGSQTSVMCITHRVFLLCIRKDPFNRFLALCINFFRTLCFSYLFNQIQILLPDVRCVYLLPLFICSAFRFARAVPALFRYAAIGPFPFPVSRCVP